MGACPSLLSVNLIPALHEIPQPAAAWFAVSAGSEGGSDLQMRVLKSRLREFDM